MGFEVRSEMPRPKGRGMRYLTSEGAIRAATWWATLAPKEGRRPIEVVNLDTGTVVYRISFEPELPPASEDDDADPDPQGDGDEPDPQPIPGR